MNSFFLGCVIQEVMCLTSLPPAAAFYDLVDEGVDLVPKGLWLTARLAHIAFLPLPLVLKGLLHHLST